MFTKILKKTMEMVVTIFIATIIIFVLIRLSPRDPVKIVMGNPEIAMTNTKEYDIRYEKMREDLNLDKSIAFQYISWIKRVLKFDFGKSIYTGRPVADEIKERIPATVLLAIPSMILQCILGISLGVISAVRHEKFTDQVIRFISVFFSSVPAFALGLMLLYYFGVYLKYYEVSNVANVSRLWLPVIVLGVISSPSLIRVVRTNMLQEFGRVYISFGIARGLSKGDILKNAIKNIALPIITILALSFVSLLSGAVVIESIFTWPGMGRYAMESILLNDYPVTQAYALFMTIMIVIINFFVDIIYTYANPKVKMGRGR